MEVLKRLKVRLNQSSEARHCRQLESVSRQCTEPHLLRNQRLPDADRHRNVSAAPNPPYIHDLASVDFFLFPRVNTSLKGHGSWDRSRGQSGFDALLQVRSRKGLSGHLPSVSYAFAEMCPRPRVLFWRVLIACSDIFNIYFYMHLVSLLLYTNTVYIFLTWIISVLIIAINS